MKVTESLKAQTSKALKFGKLAYCNDLCSATTANNEFLDWMREQDLYQTENIKFSALMSKAYYKGWTMAHLSVRKIEEHANK